MENKTATAAQRSGAGRRGRRGGEQAECPGCGARNERSARRCRICTKVLNPKVGEQQRGLAALHPDTGAGATFDASWARGDSDRSPRAGSTDRSVDPPPAPARWQSVPLPAPPPRWEPSPDDELHELAAAIVLDAPLRNGPTPPPIEHVTERFDPTALMRELDAGTGADG